MKLVLVTGGSGLIGSHAVAALVGVGHAVRVLARDESRLLRALKPFEVKVDVALGDMTNESDVAHAVAGCIAVVHAAAVIGIARRAGESTLDENLAGTDTVLSAALDAGVDPVVYLSSVAAYVPTASAVITSDSPIGAPAGGYAASKRDAEQLVRRLQVAGAPITTFVLGAVYGPPSPHPESSYASILRAATGGVMVTPPHGHRRCGRPQCRQLHHQEHRARNGSTSVSARGSLRFLAGVGGDPRGRYWEAHHGDAFRR